MNLEQPYRRVNVDRVVVKSFRISDVFQISKSRRAART